MLAELCPACTLTALLRGQGTSTDGAEPSAGNVASSSPGFPVQPAGPMQAGLPEPFGDYEFLEEIARGGMGVVYKARQRSLDRIVALKMLLPTAGADAVARFHAEAAAVAALQHPNIVEIHEVGEHAGRPYFSMAYVAGRNLAQIVRDAPLPVRRSAAYIRTIAEAVHYAHQHGILHRDLKPSNILVDESNQARITDFGLAKRLTATRDLTVTGQVLGSPNYMAPEQLGVVSVIDDRAPGRGAVIGQGELGGPGESGAGGGPVGIGRTGVGPLADIYGLGATLYHLLTGRPPFQAESLTALLRQVAEGDPVAPRLLNASVPLDLETICLRCLEKEPSQRYATAAAVAEELGRYLRGEPIRARPTGVWGRFGRWCRRRPMTAALCAALVLVGGAGVVGVLSQWRRAETARRFAIAEGQRALAAERVATERLWNAYLAQARANRRSTASGRRFDSLAALSNATVIARTLDLPPPAWLEMRNEAMASLALGDVRLHFQRRLESPLALGNPSLVFDRQHQRYARTHRDGSLTLRRVVDDVELWRVSRQAQPEFISVQLSSDGRFVAERYVEGATNALRVWDVVADRLFLERAITPQAFRLEFTWDSAQLVTVDREGLIRRYDLPSAEERPTIASRTMPASLALARDGRHLSISPYRGGPVIVINVDSGQIIRRFDHPSFVRGMSWSPDHRWLACASADGKLYVWDVASGEQRLVLGSHMVEATGVAFNVTGDLLVSTGWDATTRFWDVRMGTQIGLMTGGYTQIGGSAGEARVGFVVFNDTVGLWEVEPGRECRRLLAPRGVRNARFSPTGDLLALLDSQEVRIWDVREWRLATVLSLRDNWGLAFTPDGLGLVTSGSAGMHLTRLERDPSTADLKAASTRTLFPSYCGSLAAGPDGHTVVVPVEDGQILAFDVDGLQSTLLKDRHAHADYAAISPDGSWFATGTFYGRNAVVWSMVERRPVKEIPIEGPVHPFFTPDGNWLVTSAFREHRFWKCGTWEAGPNFPRAGDGDLPGLVAFPRDVRLMAAIHGRNSPTKLYELGGGEEIATLATGPPLCFSPDDRFLVSESEDKRSAEVWDLQRIRTQLASLGLDW